MSTDQPATLEIDGRVYALGMDNREPLVRAVIVSLFTWRRAEPSDALPADDRMGWWGDSYATVPNDRIGSRLWLLERSALTAGLPARAREYALEALQWLIDDGVATGVEVQAERQELDRLALSVLITRAGKSDLSLRFADVWEFLRAL